MNSSSVHTEVPLDTNQIKFLMDLMMGCNMGTTKIHAMQNNVSDSEVYNHLDQCRNAALSELSEGK